MAQLDLLYQQQLATESDINEHLPTFVDLVRQVSLDNVYPPLVVELGVRHGVSTIAWLYALTKVGRGHLWSVDVNFPADDAPIRQLDGADKERWTFVLGRDDAPRTLDAMPRACDIVFIDTAHTRAQTQLELEIYAPRVRSGGRIVLHDTLENAVEDGFPVLAAIEEFVAKHSRSWIHHRFNNGLGIIEM